MFDVTKLSDKDLQDFDQMMIEVAIKVEKVSYIVLAMHREILKELDSRNQIKLINGSYDDLGNAAIQRLYNLGAI